MPPGLVNQLGSKEDFLDIVRFLMDINEGGPEKLKTLKESAQ